MNQPDPPLDSGQTHALTDAAFGSHTHVIDASRPLAWLSPEELKIDLSDPAQRQFGDYELIAKIGRGGMGVVYRARQHGLERDVAIKLLAAGSWASEEFVARFRSEARSAARMQHPNIVEIYEFGHRDGLNYFSMRLIEGQSLAQRLAENGPMSGRDAAKLLRTIAEAMDYAHRLGVLHLDLKPGNVLLAANGVPLIADFGLSRRIDAGHNGGNDEISGSPSYMAPEQAMLEAPPLSAATDIYGLGAILYETLTGRPPHLGANAQSTLERVVADAPAAPRSLRKTIPADLEAICLKCLAKDPAQRYASAQQLADDLGRFTDGHTVSVRPLGPMQRMGRWTRREPRLAAALSIAVLTLLLGAAATAWQWREAVVQRDAAKLERDRAAIAGEIGAFLYANSSDTNNGLDQSRALIAWLRKRFPGDEARQADALTDFAAAVGNERNSDAEMLLATVIEVLGADYRQQVIKALQTSSDKYRNVYSAMFESNDTGDPNRAARFDGFIHAAINELPNDPLAWQVAAAFCPYADHVRCHSPQVAETLVRIEPDNMYNWLLVHMWATDAARRREALHEAAKRVRFDDYLGVEYVAYLKAIDAAGVPAPALIARPAKSLAPNERPESSIAFLEAIQAPMVAWQPLTRSCLPTDLDTLDAQTRTDCLAIGARMARSNAGVLSRMIGVAIVRPLARDTALADEVNQNRRLYMYLSTMDAKLSPHQLMSYSTTRYLQDMSKFGEMAAFQRRVVFFGMPGQPPANWQPEDPNSLLSARERRDNLIAVNDKASSLIAQARYADALGVLVPAEAATRKYFTGPDIWRVARFLENLGKARVSLGQYAAAESSLLGEWQIVRPFGPGSADAHNCLQEIIHLYVAWNLASPGKGYDAKAAEWKHALDEFDGAATPIHKT